MADPSATPNSQPTAGAAKDFTSYDQQVITPSDSTTFPMCRAIYVGTGGDLKILTTIGNTVTWKNVPDGSIVPAQATKVFATGTDAEDLLAVY